jgi:hypothetical protein
MDGPYNGKMPAITIKHVINGLSNVIEKGDLNSITGSKNFLNGDKN